MAFKTLFNEVEFIAQYPMVGLAISNTTSPVPGYLYGEINAVTYVENGSNCKALVNFLISRLQADTPFVSVKVLKLLLHLVKNGHNEMTEEVRLHEIALKKAMAFYGPPDDLHGSSFYEIIRKLSRELLDFVFSESREASEKESCSEIPQLTGYGSEASLKKLSGFGFSQKSQKSVSEKVSDGLTSFVEKLLPANDKEKQFLQATYLGESLPHYKPLIIDKNVHSPAFTEVPERPSSSHMPPAAMFRRQKSKVHKPGKPGGGWAESDEEEDTTPKPSSEVSKKSSISVDSLDISKIDLKDSSMDCIDEHIIVEEIAINVPLYKLDYINILSLCKRCSSVNCDKVLSFLIDKLASEEENIQLRALIFVEYLLFHDIVTLESLLKIVLSPLKMLSENEENVYDSVKLKAHKVCLIIENLSKTSQQQHNKQSVETHVQCSS